MALVSKIKELIIAKYIESLGVLHSKNFRVVPEAGLEPAHISILDFESSASTNFTTQAHYFKELKVYKKKA